jgi:hypothetical protein
VKVVMNKENEPAQEGSLAETIVETVEEEKED